MPNFNIHRLTFLLGWIIALGATISGFSQQTIAPATSGYWLAYSGDNKINEHFGIHSEVQMRSFFVHESVETKLFRVGLNYYIKPHAMLTAGYGYIYNTPSDDYLQASETREHRIWQQLILRQKTRKIFLEHRYRLEQRFIENLSASQTKEEHRLRYRFQSILPLYSLSPHLRHFFVVANNEIMINFRSNPSLLFDRNRFFVGAGYQVSPKLNFQLGYLNQFTHSPGRETAIIDHLLQIGVAYNMDDIMQTFFKKND